MHNTSSIFHSKSHPSLAIIKFKGLSLWKQLGLSVALEELCQVCQVWEDKVISLGRCVQWGMANVDKLSEGENFQLIIQPFGSLPPLATHSTNSNINIFPPGRFFSIFLYPCTVTNVYNSYSKWFSITWVWCWQQQLKRLWVIARSYFIAVTERLL